MNTYLKYLNPVILICDGHDWTGRSGRLTFVTAYAMWQIPLLCVKLFPPFSVPAAILFTIAGGLTFAAIGHIRRRLRDIGWSGWWVWACLIPYLGFAIVLFLALKQGTEDEAILSKKTRGGFILAGLLAIFTISRIIWEPYLITGGSMKPAVLPGDYVISTRLISPPDLGDVVAWLNPENGTVYLKRVIGLPGDTVQMINGVIILNDIPVDVEPLGDWVETYGAQGSLGLYPRCSNTNLVIGEGCIKHLFLETLPNGVSYNILDIGNHRSDYTGTFTVKDNQAFLLGDNRDNSNDSRFPQMNGGIGMVQTKDIIGRIHLVVFSMTGVSGRVMKWVP